MMAAGIGNYASGSMMNEYAGSGMMQHQQHNPNSMSIRPGSTRPGSRFAPQGGSVIRHNNPDQQQQQQQQQRAASDQPWDQISDAHRSEINDCFHLFDTNKDEQLDFSEFRYAIKALGFSTLSRPDLLNAFKPVAHARANWTPLPHLPNHPGPPPSTTPAVVDLRLSREAFQGLAARYICARDPREELLKTFSLFDKGHKGVITLDDLRAVVKELNEDIPENEMVSMIEQFDMEGKGGVSREEFVGIFLDDR